jgi:hypothetical protein
MLLTNIYAIVFLNFQFMLLGGIPSQSIILTILIPTFYKFIKKLNIFFTNIFLSSWIGSVSNFTQFGCHIDDIQSMTIKFKPLILSYNFEVFNGISNDIQII